MVLTFGYCILFLCGINGVGGEGNIDFIDFGDVFGEPLLIQFMIFAVLTDDEDGFMVEEGMSCLQECCWVWYESNDIGWVIFTWVLLKSFEQILWLLIDSINIDDDFGTMKLGFKGCCCPLSFC
jgi:hypothetical protein